MKQIGDYILEKHPIGTGQYGEVYKCYQKQDPHKAFACKKIIRSKLDEKTYKNLRNEINMLARLESPNIIKL